MKKRNILFLIMIFIFFFTFVSGCTPSGENVPDEPPMSEDEKAAREVLDAIPVEDFHVTYDGKDHHIRDAKFNYPKTGNISYDSYTKYKLPGTYPYTVTFGYEGFYREVTVNLVIDKVKPVYTGPTTVRVFLDERDDFDTSFDIEGVELAQPIHLTQTGDYTITLTTKETDIVQSIDPVEVTVYVRDVHYKFGFEDKTVIGDGVTNQTILLDETNCTLDPELFTVEYKGNEGNVNQGYYHVSATITEKANGQVYDVYRAILTIDNPKNEAFEDYVKEAFEYFYGDDQLTINILIGDYTQFGLTHQEAKWYAFEPYSDEDYAHDVEEVRQMRADFNVFKDQKLSFSQLIDYEVIDEQILEYERLFAKKEYLEMGLSYVDQYGGYAAELPTQIEGFHINNKEDLDDMMVLLGSVYDSLLSYYDYIEYREQIGYPLNEYTLTKFTEYLDGVCEVFEGGESYYLVGILNKTLMSKKDSLGLTNEQVASYLDRIGSLFNEDYYNAHKELSTKTKAYLEAAKAEGGYLANPNFDNRYLGQYENGTDLFMIRLQNRLGRYDITPEEYINQIDTWFRAYKNKWSSASSALSSAADNIASGSVQIVDGSTSFDNLLAYLKEFAKTIAPELATDPKIDVAWMDPTVTENTTTAAYYMKSPLTSTENEYIHLNENSLSSDYLDTLSTLAHEGYPGHLYAYVNTKENPNIGPYSTLNTNTTHGEGWATYVQIELNNYIAKQKNDADWAAAMEYANYYDLMSYLLYTKLDYVVNYQKADVAGLKKAVEHIGLRFGDDSVYDSLFNTFNENPAQYPAYGYGKAYFYQLHLDAQAALGEHYDVVDFNKMLLAHGWCSMDRLEGYYNQYISDQLFLAGLGE